MTRAKRPAGNKVYFESLEGRTLYSTTPAPTVLVSAADNAFAFDLFHELNKDNKGNIFFSPYSIATALQMTLLGADGSTAAEMIQTLHLPQSDLAQAGMQALYQLFQSDSATAGYELSTANRLWVNQNLHLLQSFLATEQATFGAAPETVDYSHPAQAAARINAWVSEQTRGKITDLIPPSAITPYTQLILTNAIYFKGDWASPFSDYGTRDATFHDGAAASTVNMMEQVNYFGYYAQTGANGYQAIDLPYQGGGVDMMVILPTASSLDGFESSFTPDLISQIASHLHGQRVAVNLPKFGMDETYHLVPSLKEMGMHSAFHDADFSGMFTIRSDQSAQISDVIHRSYIQVDESGTEAAGATGVIVTITTTAWTPPPPSPIPFIVDHSFLFAIRDHATGTILFMGQVTNPGYDPAANSPAAADSGGGGFRIIPGENGNYIIQPISGPGQVGDAPPTTTTHPVNNPLPTKPILLPALIRVATGFAITPTLVHLSLRPTALKSTANAASSTRVVHLTYALGKSTASAKPKTNRLVNDWLSA